MTRALVATALGCVAVDLETGEGEIVDDDPPARAEIPLSLPLVVAADRVGARIAAVVGTRPPLVLSDDAGTTWREAGGGLPAGVAVAIADDDPDLLVYASETRLFVSANGGVFWRSLPVELIDISAVAIS